MFQIIDILIARLLALETAIFWGGVISWVFFACLVGALGSARGQPGIAFFVLSLMFSPLVALLVLYFTADLRRQRLLALEHRVAMLEVRAGLHGSGEVSGEPMQYPVPPIHEGGGEGRGMLIAALIMLLAGIAIIGGASQLGRSANATFTTISESMGP